MGSFLFSFISKSLYLYLPMSKFGENNSGLRVADFALSAQGSFFVPWTYYFPL